MSRRPSPSLLLTEGAARKLQEGTVSERNCPSPSSDCYPAYKHTWQIVSERDCPSSLVLPMMRMREGDEDEEDDNVLVPHRWQSGLAIAPDLLLL